MQSSGSARQRHFLGRRQRRRRDHPPLRRGGDVLGLRGHAAVRARVHGQPHAAGRHRGRRTSRTSRWTASPAGWSRRRDPAALGRAIAGAAARSGAAGGDRIGGGCSGGRIYRSTTGRAERSPISTNSCVVVPMKVAGEGADVDVMVLCYHAVSPTWDGVIVGDPERLERQLTALVDGGWRGRDVPRGGARPPRRPRARGQLRRCVRLRPRLAFPILASLGLVGTVFAPRRSWPTARPLSWPGVDHWVVGARRGGDGGDDLAAAGRAAGGRLGDRLSHPHPPAPAPRSRTATWRPS